MVQIHMQNDIKTEHENTKHARSRYGIVIPDGEDGMRKFLTVSGTYTGDVVLEYWDGILIRDHKLIMTERLTEPTASEMYHYNLNAGEGEPYPKARMVRTPTFTTTIHDMTNVPQEIINGQWTNPIDTPTSYTATQRRGAWGIYAEDYVDVFTHQCIDPIVQRYTAKVQSMRAAMTKLKPNDSTIIYNGAIDNIARMEHRINGYIQVCDAQIEEVYRMLGIPGSGTIREGDTNLTSTLAHLKLLGAPGKPTGV
jgi:hypothetical protein